MSDAVIAISSAHIPALAEGLLCIRQTVSEALPRATSADGDAPAVIGELGHQSRLAVLDALIEQLARGANRDDARSAKRRDAPKATDVPLAGPAELLAEAVYVTLVDATEELAVGLEAYWRRPQTLPALKPTVERIVDLLAALEQL